MAEGSQIKIGVAGALGRMGRAVAAAVDARLPQVDERKLGDTRLHLFRRP